MIFLTILAGYVLVGLVAYPRVARARYDDLNRYYRYGQHSGAPNRKDREDKTRAMCDALWLTLVWPLAIYITYAKYAMFSAEIKEKKRVEAQKQQEIDLARARKILAEYRSQPVEEFDAKFADLEKTADKTERKLSRGR